MGYSVARNNGEQIAGQTITYSFGKVRDATVGLRVHVSFGLEGEAYVSRSWRRVDPGAQPSSGPADFHSLEAWTADGECDKHRPDAQKSHRGSHRKFTGVLQGDATLTVVAPRGA